MSVIYAPASFLVFLMADRLPVFLACALLAGSVCAAELGEARIASYLGRPLAADIELTMLEAPATKVEARLAHPNVYRGANIGMPQVLHTLTMTVTQRDGRQFLHLASEAPVESSNLHVFLELLDGGGRNVRLVTLSMTPDPNPAPPPTVPVPVPVPVAAPAPAPAMPTPPAEAAVVRPVAASRPVVARAAPKPEPKPAPAAPQPVTPPPQAKARPAPIPVAQPAVLTPLPLAAPAAAPAACAPASEIDRSTVCAALDYKATQLRERIGELEGKVRVLQVALGASPSGATGRPAVAPQPHPARKHAQAPAQAQPGAPWGWIAAAGVVLLAAAGAAVVLLRRRRAAAAPLALALAPLLARLRQRLARKKGVAEPAGQ